MIKIVLNGGNMAQLQKLASLTSLRQAAFASQFTKVQRSLDEFDPEKYRLSRTEEALLVAQPWTQRPFDASKPLNLPVYSFVTGRFAHEVVELDQENFN